MKVQVILYTADPCRLCTEVENLLDAMRETYPHELRKVDVDSDPELGARWRTSIPVVEINGRIVDPPLTWQALSRALRSAAQP